MTFGPSSSTAHPPDPLELLDETSLQRQDRRHPQASQRRPRDCLDKILAVADAVMVARCDLGVEMPAGQVPAIQKRIVRACRRLGKPVIAATRMLGSMVSAPVPMRAEAMVAYTSSGSPALRMACERPRAPIIGMTPKRETSRRLALVCGVNPVVCDDVTDVDDMTERATATAKSLNFAQSGQTLVIAAGTLFGTPGSTNLRIAQIGFSTP